MPFDPRQRARTFDGVADLYDAVRPGHPDAVLERVAAALPPGAHLLEIGCGTGQATVPLARRGLRIHAVERGASLARIAAERTAGLPVEVTTADFLEWTPPHPYDGLLAAQCWHWIPSAEGLARAAAALAPGAPLLLLWTLDRSEGTAFYRDTLPLYDRWLPDSPDQPPRSLPGITEQRRRDLEEHPDFGGVLVHRHPWSRTWTDGTYLDLLRTHSPVRALPEQARDAFLAEVAEVVDAHGGAVTRRLESLLLVARRR